MAAVLTATSGWRFLRVPPPPAAAAAAMAPQQRLPGERASPRRWRRPMAVVMAAASGEVCELQGLRAWLKAEGGALHPSLTLVDNAPCGARGVVAAGPIPLSELEAYGPLIAVPKHLHLENGTALEMLASWMGGNEAAAADAAEALGGGSALLVAVALAHEAALGPGSQWSPYIASLPVSPPSPWLLEGAQTGRDDSSGGGGGASLLGEAAAAALAPRPASEEGDTASAWCAAAQSYRKAAEARVAAACELLASAARNAPAASASPRGAEWLQPAALLWALGHVESRSLGTAGSSGLVPAVDLLNHDAGARPPMLQLGDDDRLRVTVLPMKGDAAVGLPRGGELTIDYGHRAPRDGWLKFGFVSAEWWVDE